MNGWIDRADAWCFKWGYRVAILFFSLSLFNLILKIVTTNV